MLRLAVLLLILSAVQATALRCATTAVVSSNLQVTWVPPAADEDSITLVFSLGSVYGGYAGFGIRENRTSGMAHADLWLAQVNGTIPEVLDTYAPLRRKPVTDAQQDVTVLWWRYTQTRTEIALRRQISTGDPTDRDFNRTGPTPVCFSWSVSNATRFPYHGANRTVSVLDFFSTDAAWVVSSASGVQSVSVSDRCMRAANISSTGFVSGSTDNPATTDATTVSDLAPLSVSWLPVDNATDTHIDLVFRLAAVHGGGYAGFGIRANASSGMQFADLWLMRVNGSLPGEVKDTYAPLRRAPVTDAQQDATVLWSRRTSAFTEIAVRRALSTTDDGFDLPFNTSGPTPVIAAWNLWNDGKYQYHGPYNRTVGMLDFTERSVGAGSSGSGGSSSAPVGAQRNVTVSPVLRLAWTPLTVNDTHITITVAFKSSTGWIGIGLRSDGGMIGSDIWLLRLRPAAAGSRMLQTSGSSGSVTVDVTDALAEDYVVPRPDSQQDVTLVSVSQQGEWTYATVRRALHTSDASDVPIAATGGVPLCFAWSTASAVSSTPPHGANRVITSFDFSTPPSRDETVDTTESDAAATALRVRKYSFHALTMGVVWIVVIPAAVLGVAFFPHVPSTASFHRAAAAASVSLTLPAAGQAMLAGGTGPLQLHHVLGYIIAALMVLQIAGGVGTNYILRGTRAPPTWFLPLRRTHKYVGYAEVLAAIFNSFLGLKMLWGDLATISAAGYALIMGVVLAVLYSLTRSSRVTKLRVSAAAKVGPDPMDNVRLVIARSGFSVTMADVRAALQAGRKWVIYRGLIVDISTFLHSHPGGAFLLESNLGEDVSSWFAGRDAVAGSSLVHAHSARAQELLLSMVVGAVKAEDHAATWAESLAVHADNDENDFTVTAVELLTKNTKAPVVRIHLSNPKAVPVPVLQWRPSAFGRHVLVRVHQSLLQPELSPTTAAATSGSAFAVSSSTSPRRRSALNAMQIAVSPRRDAAADADADGAAADTSAASASFPHAAAASGHATPTVDVNSAAVPHLGSLSLSLSPTPHVSSPDSARSMSARSRSPRSTRTFTKRGISRRKIRTEDGNVRSMTDVVERPYSIVREVDKPGIILCVRSYPTGSVSRYMGALQPGDKVRVAGPRGLGLRMDNTGRGGVLCAVTQGTGILPFFDLLNFVYACYQARQRASGEGGGGEGDAPHTDGSHSQTRTGGGNAPFGSPTRDVAPAPMVMVTRRDSLPRGRINRAGASSPDSRNSAGVKSSSSNSSSSASAHADAPPTVVPMLSSPREQGQGARFEPGVASPSGAGAQSRLKSDARAWTTNSGGRQSVSSLPHYRVVILACFETENDIVDREWLTHLHENCEDIELHFNLTKPPKQRTQPAAAAPATAPAAAPGTGATGAAAALEAVAGGGGGGGVGVTSGTPTASRHSVGSATPYDGLDAAESAAADSMGGADLAHKPLVTTGRLAPDLLVDILPPSGLLGVLCCGKPAFVQTVRKQYMSLGLPRTLFSVVG